MSIKNYLHLCLSMLTAKEKYKATSHTVKVYHLWKKNYTASYRFYYAILFFYKYRCAEIKNFCFLSVLLGFLPTRLRFKEIFFVLVTRWHVHTIILHSYCRWQLAVIPLRHYLQRCQGISIENFCDQNYLIIVMNFILIKNNWKNQKITFHNHKLMINEIYIKI